MRICTHVVLCIGAGLVGFQTRRLVMMNAGKAHCAVLPRLPTLASMGFEGSSVAKDEVPELVKGSFLKRVPEEQVVLQLPPPFLCDPFEHVMVINLEDDRGKGRRDHMVREFEKAGVKKYNFFPAVDFKKDDQLNRELKNILGLCTNPARCHNTLGCAMSHRRVYEKVLAEGWPCAMVFEDDAGLAGNFSQRLGEAAMAGMPNFDIMLLGWCHTKKDKGAHPPDQSSVPTLKNGWPGMCIHAYVISIYGALMMSQANSPIQITPDAVMDGAHHFHNRTRTHINRHGMTGAYWFTDPLMAWQDVDADNLGGGV